MKSRFAQYAAAVMMPLLIAVIVCGVLWATSSRPLPARLLEGRQLLSVAPSSTVEFNAHPGETVTAQFILKNITDEPIRLLGANTSCGCTVVPTDFPLELKPGASTEVAVQMKVESPGPNGKFRQSANLLTNREGSVPALVLEAVVSNS